VLMWTEASGQPTMDEGACDRGLPTSEQVAILIRKGMEKVLASNQQQPPCMADPLKQALVSALECEYHCGCGVLSILSMWR